jgi:hypothetical protein
MSNIKSINLRELQQATNRLFDHIIKTKGVESVELRQNFYWSTPTDQFYDVKNNPAQLDIGSLYDDWEFVQSLTRGEAEPVAFQLTEVAPLLRYIGEVVKETTGGNQ